MHPLHGNPYTSHHIYHMAFSPMIVLIDVSLSHLFVFLLHLLSISPFRCQLSCSRSSIARVVKMSKRVDQFDLYLASGLGTSPDKNPKETKCETLVDTILNNRFSLFFPIPFLTRKHHLETFESRTARALAPFVLLLIVSMLI